MPKRILVVDDDDDDREIFLEVISELDSTIISNTAVNGAEGLEKLASADPLPGMIFLDLNMPVMNGPEFLRRIKNIEHLKNIPIVIFSTSSDEWAIREVKALGVTHFITKPDKFKDWRTAIRPFIT
ncbi:MAG: response regulator [Bacteroidota bacterium]